MVLFPNAKINIGLNILRKREDGYHELESLFYPIGLKDGLEFVENGSNKVTFSASGIPIDAPAEDNLVVKAYRLLAEDNNLPGVDIHLHKVIPFGAGLGGGSSDAAFLLKGMNQFFELKLSPDELKFYAAKLGADCSFFIENRPCFATGIGEKLESFPVDLSGWHLVLVKPSVGVGTKAAYAGIKPQNPAVPLKELLSLPVEEWSEKVINDFENSVFPQFPEIAALKEQLKEMGAAYASMSGSGSSVFGLFRNDPSPEVNDFPPGCFLWTEEL